MDEKWKVIDGYPNYEISNCGNVRRLPSKRVLKQYIGKKSNYCIVRIYNSKGGKTHYTHQLVGITFINSNPCCPCCGTIYEINHKDNNPLNNTIDNLEYVTRKKM